MNKLLRTVVAGTAVVWGWGLGLPAYADLFHLTNGNTIEGLIIKETPEKLEIQFAAGGSITFGRGEIASIESADEDKREALMEKWLADKEAFQLEMKAQEEFRAQQPPPKEVPAPAPVERVVYVERIVSADSYEPKAPDLSEPIGPGYVVSYPFFDWKGDPQYKTFPEVYNRPVRRHRRVRAPEKERQPQPTLDLRAQAKTRIYNGLGTTSASFAP